MNEVLFVGSVAHVLEGKVQKVNSLLKEIFNFPTLKVPHHKFDTNFNRENVSFVDNKATLTNQNVTSIRKKFFTEGEHTIRIVASRVGHTGIGFCAQSKELAPGNILGDDNSAAIWEDGYHPPIDHQVNLVQGDIITIRISFVTHTVQYYRMKELIHTHDIQSLNQPIAFAVSLCNQGDSVEILP
eukprot:TRINITY_DN11554_c0_g1_i1.p1 TRINITY_DN11554_c0_g1~~TRINITY_DN11554_c0_g1_i1.p1  ORF type:complete len:185 (+),score=27.94 TRINITY_DN11554_c0_g1_i1:711-1265(+)